MTGPDPSGAPAPGLERLNRRRRRIGRNSRREAGKHYSSWGEYAPKHLHSTGDTSSLNTWAYIVLGTFAPFVPVWFWRISTTYAENTGFLTHPEMALRLVQESLPFLVPVAAFCALLVIGSRVRIWWEQRR